MRRLALALAAVACALAAFVAAPALPLTPPVPPAVEFRLTPPGADGLAPAADGRLVSRPLEAPARFDLLGLRWDDADVHRPVHADVRVRRAGRDWSRWIHLPEAGDHGEDGAPPLAGTEPAWVGGADVLQLRLSRRPRGLRVHFVNTTGTATAADRARTTVRRTARAVGAALVRPITAALARSDGPPPIVSRAAWGADQCPPRQPASYGSVEVAFVHHTVTANSYGPEDSAGMVRAICLYHRNSNRWNDIGYNFLVDRYGQVFEGRAGGVDQAVIGAQTQGYNAQSTGIAALGTFEGEGQTEPGLTALADLIGWKLPHHGRPTQGTVTLRSAGGSSNRYREGSWVTFERISGHRDGNSTSCPGQALYDQLPRLRGMVGTAGPARAGTALTATAPREVRYREPAWVSGRLTSGGNQGVPEATIEVQAQGSRGWRAVARARTGLGGDWSTALRSSRSRVLRAVFAGDAQRAGSTAGPLRVGVEPRLAASTPRKRVPAGRRGVVSGTIHPRKRVLRVVVRRKSGRRYKRFASSRVRVSRGRFRYKRRLSRPGLYRFTVSFPGDSRNAPARTNVYVRALSSSERSGGTLIDLPHVLQPPDSPL